MRCLIVVDTVQSCKSKSKSDAKIERNIHDHIKHFNITCNSSMGGFRNMMCSIPEVC